MTSPTCSGACFDGFECTGGSVSPSAVPCSSGYYCLSGVKVACPAGSYSTSGAVRCTLCSNGTASATIAASSSAACVACTVHANALLQEGSGSGAADCWPGLLSVVASNPPPIIVGFSVHDVVEFVFDKPTNAPLVPAPVVFYPPLGTLAMGWSDANTKLTVRIVDAGGVSNPIPPSSVEIGVLNFSLQVRKR